MQSRVNPRFIEPEHTGLSVKKGGPKVGGKWDRPEGNGRL